MSYTAIQYKNKVESVIGLMLIVYFEGNGHRK